VDALEQILHDLAMGDPQAIAAVAGILRRNLPTRDDPNMTAFQEVASQWRAENRDVLNEADYALCQRLDEDLSRSHPGLESRTRLNIVSDQVRRGLVSGDWSESADRAQAIQDMKRERDVNTRHVQSRASARVVQAAEGIDDDDQTAIAAMRQARKGRVVPPLPDADQ
jgi:hypothetical protein